MRTRTAALVIGGLCVLIVAWSTMTETGRLLTGRWSFTKWAEVDRGTYFRLKVDLTYKGEPQHFDVVVGCNVVAIGYNDGSSTREVGLVPTVYGRRMSDGKGLVVRVPDACKGQSTENGEVPPDFLPVMIVYDDADTLAFGTAYLSDEAYESPLSLMKFDNAKIEKATRAEFQDFRSNGAPNLVTRNQYHSAQPKDVVEAMGLTKIYPPFGRKCHAYSRYRIPEELRPNVRKFWPNARPNYWMPATGTLKAELWAAIRKYPLQRDDGGEKRKLEEFSYDSNLAAKGASGRDGRAAVDSRQWRTLFSPSFYPASSDLSPNRWPSNPDDWLKYIQSKKSIEIVDVDFRDGQMRGFGYCYDDPGFVVGDDAWKSFNRKPGLSKMDGQLIIGGPDRWSTLDIQKFYERDEYIFLFNYFYLESTRGDV